MKIVFKTDVAKKMFETIANGISQEKVLTIQSMYWKKEEENTMLVKAMDKTHVLEMHIKYEEEEGFDEIYIPFFEINKFITKFKSEKTIFEKLDGDVLKVSSGKSYGKTSLVNLQQAPDVNVMLNADYNIKFLLNKKVLTNIKNKLTGLVSTDNNRPVLNGVCFDIVNGCTNFAASDGKKLAVYYDGVTTIDDDTTINHRVIVPLDTINRINSIVNSDEIVVKISSEKYIAFECNDLIYYSCLINGSYPPYQNIVKGTDKNTNSITINRVELTEALSFVNLKFDITKKCELKFSDKKLSLDYNNGDSYEEFDIDYEGEFSCLINSQFLEKMIRPLQSENIIFKFATATDAILIESDNIKMVLMPLKAR